MRKEGGEICSTFLKDKEPCKTVLIIVFCLYRDRAYSAGKSMCERLKDTIPRQMFEIAVQAAIGSKIIARET